MLKFTPKRKKMFDFIANRCDGGLPPSVREVAEEFYMTINGAYQNIQVLVDLGYLTHVPGISRGLRVKKRPKRGIPIVTLEDLTRKVTGK